LRTRENVVRNDASPVLLECSCTWTNVLSHSISPATCASRVSMLSVSSAERGPTVTSASPSRSADSLTRFSHGTSSWTVPLVLAPTWTGAAVPTSLFPGAQTSPFPGAPTSPSPTGAAPAGAAPIIG
jgi:hypothetical protein